MFGWMARLPVPKWFARWWIYTFRRIDTDGMCPACGHRNGAITSVTDGHAVAIEHLCKVCNWVWQEGTVLAIEPTEIVRQAPPTPHEEELEAAMMDKTLKAVRNRVSLVNNEEVKA